MSRKPGWYDHPDEGLRYWDGERWTNARRRNPTRTLIGVALGALALIVGSMWYGGALDEPLSSIGLNKNACVENLFGNKICGDQLTSFCEENYNARINGDVCDGVLEDAGIDPAAIRERQEQAREAYEACVDREIQSEDTDLDACEPP